MTGLSLTAKAEARVAEQISKRPKSATSIAARALVGDVASLLAIADKETTFPEDAFQAQVCVAWFHSIEGGSGKVLSQLSASNVAQAIEKFTNIVSPTARWTHVCIVKGACLRGEDYTLSIFVGESLIFLRSCDRKRRKRKRGCAVLQHPPPLPYTDAVYGWHHPRIQQLDGGLTVTILFSGGASFEIES